LLETACKYNLKLENSVDGISSKNEMLIISNPLVFAFSSGE
jgi:hypothetical protein